MMGARTGHGRCLVPDILDPPKCLVRFAPAQQARPVTTQNVAQVQDMLCSCQKNRYYARCKTLKPLHYLFWYYAGYR